MKCNTCNTEFDDVYGINQANGCAATLYKDNNNYYILAAYGSQFDMQRYALKSSSYAPITRGMYTVGNICDECINKYILDGYAHLIEDGVW